MMTGSENMTVAPHSILGGGYGGYGGCGYGFGGGAGGAAIGGFLGAALGNGTGLFGNRGYGNNCGCGCGHNHGCCDGYGRGIGVDIVLDDAHYNSLTNNIGQVKAEVGATTNSIKAEVGNKFDHFATRFNAFELANCSANYGINMGIAETKFQGALNTKDIIHDLDTKICMTNRNIDETKYDLSRQIASCCCETQKAIEGLKSFYLTDELAQERAARRDLENSFRIGNLVASSVRATTNGSNFNTGTQTQSNNSGQIVGQPTA